MKRSFLWAAVIAAMAISGCSSEESTQSSSSKALTFGTYVEKASRGQNALLSTSYPVNGRFLVLGYSGADLSTPLLNYMREVVTYDGSSYSYFPVHYWPDNADISFFAIHPADDVIGTTIPGKLNDATNKVLPSVAFTVNADPLAQADLMMASALHQTGTPPTVNFAFGHQLTRIGFAAKLADDYNSKGDYIRIKSITIDKVANLATFGFGSDGKVSQTVLPVTTDFIHSFSLDYTKNMKNSGSVTSTGSFAQVNLDNSYLLMIPADYSTATTTTVGDNSHATITVNYDVECADGTSSSHTITKAVNTLTAGNIWKANQAITFNMTISLTAVNFTANIVDWDPSLATTTPIN